MCVKIHYTIDLDVLKEKYNCNKIINSEKLKKGMINKKNYLPIIYESNESVSQKENVLEKKKIIIQVCLWGINAFNYGKFEKDITLINARLETLHLKKSFKILINKNRCAIIVNGYFEWKTNNNSSKKTPYYIFNGKSKKEVKSEKNSSKEEKCENLDEKNNKEIKDEQNIKSETIENDIIDNKTSGDDQLVEPTSLKRKNIIKEEIVTKKIKIKSSNEELDENDSYIIIAGLYSTPDNSEEEFRNTVITTSSENTNLKGIHERCPLLLSENTLPLWLDIGSNYSDIIDKIKEEHVYACNKLKYVEVQNWYEYSNYSKKEKKESILKYIKI